MSHGARVDLDALGRLAGIRSCSRHRLRRGTDVDRAARPDRVRRNHDPRSHRRHRAERAAHGPRQAQRARAAARREDRARARQRAGRAGDRVYVPEGSRRPAERRICASRGRSPFPTPTFEQVLESAARSFKAHGFRDIVLLGDHGGYQSSDAAVADRARSRMEGHAGARARAFGVLRRGDERLRAPSRKPRFHCRGRSARTQASPTPRLHWRSTRRLVRAEALRPRHTMQQPVFTATHAAPARSSARLRSMISSRGR